MPYTLGLHVHAYTGKFYMVKGFPHIPGLINIWYQERPWILELYNSKIDI